MMSRIGWKYESERQASERADKTGFLLALLAAVLLLTVVGASAAEEFLSRSLAEIEQNVTGAMLARP